MATLTLPSEPVENRLLAALPHDEYDRLLPQLQQLSLGAFDRVFFIPGSVTRYPSAFNSFSMPSRVSLTSSTTRMIELVSLSLFIELFPVRRLGPSSSIMPKPAATFEKGST
jgi:hypothetical protein